MARRKKTAVPEVNYDMYLLEDFEEGDVIEFMHPTSKKSESGRFGVGRFVKTIERKGSSKILDIEVATFEANVVIQRNNIRWERTLYHINKGKVVEEPVEEGVGV